MHAFPVLPAVLLRLMCLLLMYTRFSHCFPANDWEILELNQAQVEEGLLSQICVLTIGRSFPFWCRGALIHLRVLSSVPDSKAGAT